MPDYTRLSRYSSVPSVDDLLRALGHRDTDRVSICSKPAQGGFRAKLLTVDQVAAYALPSGCDVWFSPNPVSRGVSRGRGTDDDVPRVRALFADLDVKPGALASVDECVKVVGRLSRALGQRPVALVYTGGGVHPYWRIASPRSRSGFIVPETDGARLDREGWRLLYERWGGLVQAVVTSVNRNAHIDNVYQLSHIMRCPGTVNQKYPASVVTELCPLAQGVRWDRIKAAVDRDGIGPLSGVLRPRVESVPTSWAEAIEWVNAQPGAGVGVMEMRALGPHRSMLADLDEDALLRLFISGDSNELSAHNLMRNKVQSVVYQSCENRAGLVLALEVVERAYLRVMELRREGRVGGDRRDEIEARQDFRRAVTGAVARGRARRNSPKPQRDSDGRIVLRTRREKGLGA